MYELDTIERLGSWRTNGRYIVSRAHKLTGVSESAIKWWLKEYPAALAQLKAHWQEGMGRPSVKLSFLELIEVLVAGKIRVADGGSFRQVRQYHDAVAAEWGTPFPFAHENLLQQEERFSGAVIKTLQQMDYEAGFVSRWCPMGKDQPIAIDPRCGSGAPTIKGRRLRVEDLRDYFEAGESIEFLASDFDLEPHEVEAVLRYAFLSGS